MSEVTNQEQKAYCLDILENGCGELGLTLTEEQKQQFVRYYEMLVEWNKVMNLTGITEFGEVLTKHFVDSLSIVKALDMENIKSCIDVGTGAGFPGIPLKIVFPHLQVTLLDSLNKRLKFLDAVIEDLGLEGTTPCTDVQRTGPEGRSSGSSMISVLPGQWQGYVPSVSIACLM